MIRVAIRFDDPSPTSDRVIEAGLIDALEDAQLRATWAITPFGGYEPRSPALDAVSGADILSAFKRGTIEVALHGHSHKNRRSERDPSEFAGLPLDDQLSMLEAAKNHLCEMFGSHSIVGFVPPWNSYDLTTVRAVERMGFQYISAAEYHPRGDVKTLAVVPRTCQFMALESAIQGVRHLQKFRPYVIAVLHPHNFHESGDDASQMDLMSFKRRLAWLTHQRDVEIMTLSDMVKAAGTAVLNRLAQHWFDLRGVHWRLRNLVPRQALLDASAWRLLLCARPWNRWLPPSVRPR